MKFRYIHKVDGLVPTYQGLHVTTGDIVDLNPHFSDKASRNPQFELYVEPVSGIIEPAKSGRKKTIK